jgi:hypothetical protein
MDFNVHFSQTLLRPFRPVGGQPSLLEKSGSG